VPEGVSKIAPMLGSNSCSSAHLMTGKLNLIFLFHPRGGEPCNSWGVGFVFSEGGIDTHGLCFGIMSRYYGLYYGVLFSHLCLIDSWSAEHWTCKVLEKSFLLQKKEIVVEVHYSHAVFVMRNISSETAVCVWQFYTHLG